MHFNRIGDKYGKDRNSANHYRPRGDNRSLVDIDEFGDDIRAGNMDNEQSKLGEVRNLCVLRPNGVSAVPYQGEEK